MSTNTTALYGQDEYDKTITSLYFCLFAGLLAIILILAKMLHERPWLHYFVSEATMVLLIGTAAGCIIWTGMILHSSDERRYYQDDENLLAQRMLSFSPRVFFMALLPPILFYSGYQLRRELFYRHITPIVVFAVVGTTLSASLTALTLMGVQIMLGGSFDDFTPTTIELLAFGSLIAATDTVSVVAVLRHKRVDPHLFYVVFGESALNDAVALVLFNSFADLLTRNITAGTLARASTAFCVQVGLEAIGSPVVGIVSGFAVALLFKHIDFRHQPMLELCLYLLMMYFPYMIAESLQLSGIVTVFFGGMSARRYIAPNLTNDTRQMGERLFKITAYLAEVCIFLELGLSVFGFSGSFNLCFVAVALVTCLLARALTVYPLCYLYNVSLREECEQGTLALAHELNVGGIEVRPKNPTVSVALDNADVSVSSGESYASRSFRPAPKRTPHRRRDQKISTAMAHMLWLAGLRGAVAYACVRQFPNVNSHDDEFIAATMAIVGFTIIIMGGATEFMLEYLGIQTNVDEEAYMEEWHKARYLKGALHEFEQDYMYSVAVPDNDKCNDDMSAQFDYQAADCPIRFVPHDVSQSPMEHADWAATVEDPGILMAKLQRQESGTVQ